MICETLNRLEEQSAKLSNEARESGLCPEERERRWLKEELKVAETTDHIAYGHEGSSPCPGE